MVWVGRCPGHLPASGHFWVCCEVRSGSSKLHAENLQGQNIHKLFRQPVAVSDCPKREKGFYI